jgi:hypothetical protein
MSIYDSGDLSPDTIEHTGTVTPIGETYPPEEYHYQPVITSVNIPLIIGLSIVITAVLYAVMQ